MITTDFYNKDLSSSFNSAIIAAAQKVKPKILVTWLDSRHLDNLTVTTNDAHANNAYPNQGFFFGPSQAFNGLERQSFTWGVADAKNTDGDVIRADGTWFAMPTLSGTDLSASQMSGALEFGWWSNSQSNSNVHPTYNGYGFITDPYIEATFDSRKVNKVRIVTSEYYGQIYDYQLILWDANSNVVLTENGTIRSNTYYQDHFVSSALSTQNIAKIRVTVRSTKNPSDNARIQEIIPMYQEDMSDYVMSYSVDRTRDIHTTSLPIGGSGGAGVTIDFDNTGKKFNLYNTSSQFGQYMKQDIKIEVFTGWRIKKPSADFIDNVYLSTHLIANANTSANTILVNDITIFPTGGSGNYFVAIVDRNTQSEEYLLCSNTSGSNNLNILERGYAGTVAKQHSTGSTIEFEVYEYVKQGTFFVDEWRVSSDMKVQATCQNWTKKLSEQVLSFGFLMQNALVGEAIDNLLMRANYPKKNINRLTKYNKGSIERGAVAAYSFNEDTVDRSGNSIVSSTGLRARFWGMPSNRKDSSVKDILADAIDKELTQLDKALGLTSFVSPSYTALSKNISDNASSALELTGYSFTGTDSSTYSDYYNGVIDGYYVPSVSGAQTIVVYVQSGGVRVYLDDILILDKFRLFTTNTRLESSSVNLVAGVPRKIRIEFYHTFNNSGSASFNLKLYKSVGGGADALIPASDCYTITAIDYIGAKDPSSNTAVADVYNHRNNGIYISAPKLNQTTGLVSDTKDKSVLLESNAYIRIPYDESFDLSNSNASLYTGSWTIEFYGKFGNGSFSNSGEYLSTWANATPSKGFELYNNAASNGIKIITSSGTETISYNTALSNTNFTHIVATYNGSNISYYINGISVASNTLNGTPVAWSNSDITIGGRGASFTSGAEVAPSEIRSFTVDEFAIYNKALTAIQVKERYIESQIQPLTTFAFLYGNEKSIQEVINDITFADLGRMYIDELDIARYEHYYRFFESSIDQHANIQANISDNTHIQTANYIVQLQCNKVVVPIAGVQRSTNETQLLWGAESNSSLTTANLSANIAANANVAYVSSTTNPPFPENGYLKIDSEIIKYSSKTATSFNNLERAQFQTTASSHSANTKVRETRYYDIKFEKAPAFNIKLPFITANDIEDPNKVEIHKYLPYAYGAELIVSTSSDVNVGEIIFLEGVNPLTEYVYNFRIAGSAVVISEQNLQIKEQSASNSESIKKYGLKDIAIESEFISDSVHAKNIADFIINKTQLPVPILNINTIGMPKLQLGDRIRITNMSSLGITNSDYWVISHTFSVGGDVSHDITLRKVS
jgi:hypothetical protein